MPDPLTESDAVPPAGGGEDGRRPLPERWRMLDGAVLRLTEVFAFLVGIAFTVLVTLEVVSRYVFDFSITFVNAGARMLLIWFFLLGAGLALRRGAHVGFVLLRGALSQRLRRAVVLAAHSLSLAFFGLMLWSGMAAFGPSLRQAEAGLGVSLAWGMAAVPVGFALMIYHLLVLAWTDPDGVGAP